MYISVVIRVLGLVIGYVVFSATSILIYGFDLILSDQPLMIFPGIANIAWWLCGLFSSLLLVLVHNYARWFLIAFFLLSFVSAMIGWIPGTWYLSETIESGIGKTIILQSSNLIFVVLVLWLYALNKKQSNKSLNLTGAKNAPPS